MTQNVFRLMLLPYRLAICRLPPDTDAVGLVSMQGWYSLTRSENELSVVCPEESVPAGSIVRRGWRALRVVGTLDFELVGVMASLVGPLADACVSVFVISTFDTDFILVQESQLEIAELALETAGHTIGSFVIEDH